MVRKKNITKGAIKVGIQVPDLNDVDVVEEIIEPAINEESIKAAQETIFENANTIKQAFDNRDELIIETIKILQSIYKLEDKEFIDEETIKLFSHEQLLELNKILVKVVQSMVDRNMEVNDWDNSNKKS